jgi:precorrin-8X/cobalt-precorrin-8 methylmutase
MKPEKIEAMSFKIIDQEAGSHGFTFRQWQIVRRMIHTSADFEWMRMIRFHPEAIDAGIQSIRQGQAIITDTRMACMGIRRELIAAYGGSVQCYMSDPTVAEKASKAGQTRARMAVDAALAQFQEGGIYVVGNAPTALLRLIELVRNGSARPALIIGLPVGFVNAAESKQTLMGLNWPCISNVGRKGGSALAASVVNALALLAGSDG